MSHRQICTMIVCVLALVVLPSVGDAQSKKQDDPTPLTSNEVSGVIDKNTKDNIYRYYSFWANPGEVKVTATVERDMNIDNGIALMSAEFVLFDSNSEVIAKKSASTYFGSESPKGVATAQVEIAKRQLLVLGIKLPGGTYFEGVGKYKVRIDGADITSKNTSSEMDNNYGALLQEELLRFPEKGYLRVGLVKEGTMLIKLESVEYISIYDPAHQFKMKRLDYGEIRLPQEGRLSIHLKDFSAQFAFDLSQIVRVECLSP